MPDWLGLILFWSLVISWSEVFIFSVTFGWVESDAFGCPVDSDGFAVFIISAIFGCPLGGKGVAVFTISVTSF